NFERYSTPFKKGDKYYYFKNDGLQNQSVMYVQETLDGPATEVLNPNEFSDDGTASLAGYSFSKDGRYLAYQVSEGGSDWQTAYVKDLTTGEVLSDKVEWIKFSSLSWSKDGFFYCRYPEPEGGSKLSSTNEFHQVYYHKVGDSQDKDQLVFADRANPQRGFFTSTSQDERFLMLGIWESTSGNALYFKDLSQENADFIALKESIVADFSFVDNIDNNLLVLTNYNAPNWRLVSINVEHPEEGYWEDLIPESTDVLRSVDIIGGKLVATYINNASSLVTLYDLKGQPEVIDFKLPSIGTIGGFSGDKDDSEAFYSFSSFTRPTTIYSFDVKTNTSKIFKAPSIDFDSDKYVTKQVWYKGYDGTRVPMFVTHKKDLQMDGNRPTLLYGYGGFDIPILPGFNTTRLNMAPIILENDGVFVVANIRGGGEFGKAWHQAGTKERKQNVFNDFQAAAEHLIAQKYTSPDKLAIYGRSNGGLLVGACMTQRPDLYKVALPAVGVLDMLRYQYFTIGRAWASDYGLSEDPNGFDYLYQYSPLHNAVPAKYPATMITTADHDDRVVPAHSFKFAAALQENQNGDLPVLIRVETSAGHGAGKPTSKKIEEAADILSFTFYNFEEDVKYDYKMLQ
ncbi:MAG: prolyl oligopeptidase family serine peptidase, partial [Bacteroidota bacterium]